MKFTSVLASSFLAATAFAQYNVTSKPFHLRTTSDDKQFDGTYFSTCHEGAALESLCVASKNVKDAATFHFNTSYYPAQTNKALGETGYLTWQLKGGNFVESEPMSLQYDPPTSNMVLALFEPTEQATLVAFDKNNHLNIQGYIDDTQNPIKAGPTKAYYRWYVCKTYYAAYRYTALTWIMGNGKPENPTCSKVDVERVFL